MNEAGHPVLTIEERHGLADVEGALAELANAPRIADLLLPTNLHHRQFGGLAALIQYVVSWAHKCPEGALRVHVSGDEWRDRTLENFAITDHGLSALTLAGNVLTRDGRESLRAEALKHCAERLGKMTSVPEVSRGSKAFIMAADHTPYGTPILLYPRARTHSEPKPRSWSGFHDLSRRLLERLTEGPQAKLPNPETVARLATVLWQLFLNTHEWARHTAQNERIAPSIRGIRAELYSHSQEQHQEMVKDDPMLSAYLSTSELRSRETSGRQRIIEFSVFDSGPGLAARRLLEVQSTSQGHPHNVTIGEECQAVIDCLRKHFSTGGPSHRGDGLHEVMMTLTTLHGFLRIRTGRLALARDFVTSPYATDNSDSSDSQEPYLLDWSTQSLRSIARPSVAGTLISAMFPVTYGD